MELKINRYNFDVTNEDWILDNGSCYQCMTLTHKTLNLHHISDMPTIMSKKQFMELKKKNLLIDDTETFKQLYPRRFGCWEGLKIWRFNINDNNKQKEGSIKLKTEDKKLNNAKKELLAPIFRGFIYEYAFRKLLAMYAESEGIISDVDLNCIEKEIIAYAEDEVIDVFSKEIKNKSLTNKK